MRDAFLLQHLAQHLGFFDGCRADKDRLALLMRLPDALDDRLVLFARGAIDLIMVILALDGAVRWNLDHAQAVDFGELLGLGRGGAGHAGQLFVEAEVVLEGHAGERDVLGLDLDALFRLDRLMQPVRQAPALHHPAGEFVDQDHLAVADDIVLVALEQLVGTQGLRDMVDDGRRFRVIKRLVGGQDTHFLEAPLDIFVAILGEGGVAGLFIDLVVVGRQFGNIGVKRLVKLGPVLRGAGDDQRRARLVHKDRVDLVHDGEGMAALRHLFERTLHVVAQVVEAQFVVRRIGDVGAVGVALFLLALERIDDAGGQAKLGIDLAHPARVPLGQIIVHGDDMYALAGQRVQIGREGRDQRLAFAGAHFGDVALMQEDPAHQLHVEGAQAKRTARTLAAVGEGFRQNRFQAFACRHARFQRLRPFPEAIVAQRLEIIFERVDLRHQRAHGFDPAVVGRAKDLPRDCS